jgi:hypothetical protein
VSADSAFVEDVLTACARQLFRLPLPEFDDLLDAAHDVIPRILDTYPHAESMLIRIVTDRYPHPVRPAEEHRVYAHAVLAVATYAPTNSLAAALVSIVVEKLTIIDAMVPDVVGEFVAADAARDASPVSTVASPVHLPASPRGADAADAEVFVLDGEAQKLDGVLVEFFTFSAGLAEAQGRASSRRLSAIVAAVERFVIPSHGARHVPFILLHAASAFGRDTVLSTVERFRVSFFDPTLPHRVRAAYLHFSAALVARADCVTSTDASAWLERLTLWMHSYIDERRDTAVFIDVDVHDSLYAAVFAFMSVVSIRPDVFSSRAGGSGDAANNMRFMRIMRSDFNPLLVMSASLVSSFCKAVEEHGGMSFEDILEDNLEATLPSRTRFGNPNRFSAFLPLEPCRLPLAAAFVRPLYLRQSRPKARNSLGSMGSLGRVANQGMRPGARLSASKKRLRPMEQPEPLPTSHIGAGDARPSKRRRKG